MSTFQDVQKYLRRIKGRKATDADLQNSNVLPDPTKYDGKRTRTRDIKWISTCIVLPVFSQDFSATSRVFRLMFQYNVAFTSNFYILNSGDLDFVIKTRNCFITVKWRVGTTVFRYMLTPTNVYFNPVKIEQYTNKLIGANCVFEVWSARNSAFPSGITQPLKIKTSLLSIPNTPDDLELDFNANPPLQLATIGVNLPEILPYNQPDIVWNNN